MKLKEFFKRFGEKHASLWQFIKYAALSTVASVVEFAVFALLNFWVFSAWQDVSVDWWILHYNGEHGGGLCGLLATAISYIVGQIYNFVVQRKLTFHSNNSAAASGLMYAAMTVGIWFIQIWFVGVMMTALAEPLGHTWGDLLAKTLSMTLSFCIQFPLNKFVIMKRTEKKPKTPKIQG